MDNTETSFERATGHTPPQMARQVIAGLLIAGVVGAVSAWGALQALGPRLVALSDQITDMRAELREMRRDLYSPRYAPGRPQTEALIRPSLPPGRP